MRAKTIIIIIIGLYLLFGALLFGVFIFAAAKKSNVLIGRAVYSIAITTESRNQYEEMSELMLFIFKLPEVIPLVINYIKS